MGDVFCSRVHDFAVLEDTHAFAFDKYVGGRGGGDVGGVNNVVESVPEFGASTSVILFFKKEKITTLLLCCPLEILVLNQRKQNWYSLS